MTVAAVSLLDVWSLDRPQARKLMETLVSNIDDVAAVRALAELAGVPTGRIRTGNPEEAWHDVLDHAGKNKLLARVVESVRADPLYAAVAEVLDGIVKEPVEEEIPYDSASSFDARLLKGVPDVFIDRVDVRKYLQALFLPDKQKVVVITGPSLSGKSYTWNLIKHIQDCDGVIEPRKVDFSDWTQPPDPEKVMAEIALQLNLVAQFREWRNLDLLDDTAQGSQQAQSLVSWLKGQLAADDRNWWLVFDSLDKVAIDEGTVALLQRLAAAAHERELGKLRVVLCGYTRDLPPSLRPFVLMEDLKEIGSPELQTFFKTAAEHVMAAKRVDSTLPDEVYSTAAESVMRNLDGVLDPEERAILLPGEAKKALVAVIQDIWSG